MNLDFSHFADRDWVVRSTQNIAQHFRTKHFKIMITEVQERWFKENTQEENLLTFSDG